MEQVYKQWTLQKMTAAGDSVQEEAAECTLPDGMPDVSRILDVSGMLFLRDRMAGTGYADVKWEARIQILYEAEESAGLHKLEASYRYTHHAAMHGAEPEADVFCRMQLHGLECRILHPRKLGFRIESAFHLECWETAEEKLLTGLEGDEAVQQRLGMFHRETPLLSSVRSFHLLEETDIAALDVQELLETRGCVVLQNSTCGTNQVMLEGELYLTVLYRSSHALAECGTYVFPFAQTLDVPGVTGEMQVSAQVQLKNLEAESALDLEGSAKTLSVSAACFAELLCTVEEDVEGLQDAYSTRADLEILREPYTCRTGERFDTKTADFDETVETDAPADRIIDARLEPLSVNAAEGERCVVSCAFHALYESQGMLQSLSRKLLLYGSECPMLPRRVRVEQLQCGTEGENIRLRGQLSYTLHSVETVSFDAVMEVKEVPLQASAQPRCAILVRFPGKDSDLWETAKEYRTTCDAIREANHLSGEAAPSGPILIPLV